MQSALIVISRTMGLKQINYGAPADTRPLPRGEPSRGRWHW
jgi:hypothetical protein